MLPSIDVLRHTLAGVIQHKAEQGHLTEGLQTRLEALPDHYDDLHAFALELEHLPQRQDWPYVEPEDWADILAECDPERADDPVEVPCHADRVETAFLSRVAGCMLGKPLEISPTFDEILNALEPIGDWPLRDYVSEKAAAGFARGLHHCWRTTTREHQRYVTNDDDMNYAIIGLLVLEKHGVAFIRDHLRSEWMGQLPLSETFGPERLILALSGLDSFKSGGWRPEWVSRYNPREEYCGALIRADAYGWACAGRPGLAARLAWKDAGFTHRRTGVYGSMFVAAALAAAPGADTPMAVFETALQYVPRRSRFAEAVRHAMTAVAGSGDWIEAYQRIHSQYRDFGHCRVFQEIGTLVNTLCHAESIGDGICKQVMQGNDTDSFGATAGSLLGMYFGPGHLEERWITPFNDELRLALAQFWEPSLQAVARRAAALPDRVAADLRNGISPDPISPDRPPSATDADTGVVAKSNCRG
ncbi:MAG: ADP-ribosylglycohydrolase family protein [Verrucomicrobia bacterium]|nr:ADP-ribosylglycohydrolase family protein [Verrucomicrobiota bacterium]MCH8511797.1 ADP-ribosylglycohydrolase family protein [Kiritimatiellia bacterium]